MGKSNQVPVNCAVCNKAWTVKASRARQNASITCGRECFAEQARRRKLARNPPGTIRTAQCARCGKVFERKPSQLAKYATPYCSVICKQADPGNIAAARAARANGQWHPCESCGKDVWRTPGTLQPRVFCTRQCSGKANPKGYHRVERLVLTCTTCHTPYRILPGHAIRNRRHCSPRCSARTVQGAKRGLPGNPWGAASRIKLSATLVRKFSNEWTGRRLRMAEAWSGRGNPQWRDGRARTLYAPGFTARLKKSIADRDRHKCRICGAPRGRGTHVVHHIDGEKHDHSPENLVLLCHHCHGKTHQRMLKLLYA